MTRKRLGERRARSGDAKPRVLMYPLHRHADDNPFVALLTESVSRSFDVIPFSWQKALFSDYEVLHVHWPESLVKDRRRYRALGKSLLLILLLAINKVRGRRVIETVHNLEPHETPRAVVRIALACWQNSVNGRVYLSEASRQQAGDPSGIVIEHGDYSAMVRVNRAYLRNSDPDVILIFGYLRPYKGIDQLIDAHQEIAAEYRLRVVGRALSSEYGAALQRRAKLAQNVDVEASLRNLSDAELIREISGAGAIVLPYRNFHNSGAALLALSCARPVIAKRSPSSVELQQEVGEEWLQLFEGELDSTKLHDCLAALRERRRVGASPLKARDWASIGERYARFYQART